MDLAGRRAENACRPAPTAERPGGADALGGAPASPVPLPQTPYAAFPGGAGFPAEPEPDALGRLRAAEEPDLRRSADPAPPEPSLERLRRRSDPGGPRPLPAPLQDSIHAASGVDLSHVQVHYESPLPHRIGAAAFTRGSDIHLAPGADRELAHEAWHVVQQRQGRVSASGSVAGHATNSDHRLEAEADEQGRRAASRAGTPDVAPAGPRAVSQPASPVGPASGGPVLQARWLIHEPDVLRFSGFFWEDQGDGIRREDEPPPTIWERFRELTGPDIPSRGTYWVADLRGERVSRTQARGLTLARTMESYAAVTKGSATSRASHDTYNPFGRFTSSATVVAFIPALSAQDPAGLLDQVGERTDKLERIKTRGTTLTPDRRYPTQVLTVGDHLLDLVSQDELGAVYADIDVQRSQALPVRAAQDPSALNLVAPVPETRVEIGSGAEHQTYATRVKIVHASAITAEKVKAWSGVKRSENQAQVMGNSAGIVAENAGYDRNGGRGWEWLHLIAHSMGGPDRLGPQTPENLVVGTSECNSHMIVVEEVLKDLVERYGLVATLAVRANIVDDVRHITDAIHYDFSFKQRNGKAAGVFRWTFDPLGRSNPLDFQNLRARLVARHHFGDGEQLHPTTDRADFPAETHEPTDLRPEDRVRKPAAPRATLPVISGNLPAIERNLIDAHDLRWHPGGPQPVAFLTAVHQAVEAVGLTVDRAAFLQTVTTRFPSATGPIPTLAAVSTDLLDAVCLALRTLTGRTLKLVVHGYVVNSDLTVSMRPRAQVSRVRAAPGLYDEIDLDIMPLPDGTFIALRGDHPALNALNALRY